MREAKPFYEAELYFKDGGTVLVAMTNDLQKIKVKATDTMKAYKNGHYDFAFKNKEVSHIEITKTNDTNFKPIKIS